jgi:hypothetical protein
MKLVSHPLALAALAAALVSLTLPISAGATPSAVAFNGMVTVTSQPCVSGPAGCIVNPGTWTASGAVTGSFAVSEKTWFGNGTVHDVSTVTGSDGTITIEVDARFVAFTASSSTVRGDWTITSGTGSYANLHANGTYAATVDSSAQPELVSESLTGSADYDSRSA